MKKNHIKNMVFLNTLQNNLIKQTTLNVGGKDRRTGTILGDPTV